MVSYVKALRYVGPERVFYMFIGLLSGIALGWLPIIGPALGVIAAFAAPLYYVWRIRDIERTWAAHTPGTFLIAWTRSEQLPKIIEVGKGLNFKHLPALLEVRTERPDPHNEDHVRAFRTLAGRLLKTVRDNGTLDERDMRYRNAFRNFVLSRWEDGPNNPFNTHLMELYKPRLLEGKAGAIPVGHRRTVFQSAVHAPDSGASKGNGVPTTFDFPAQPDVPPIEKK